ncbi:MAG: hypothetical protein HQM00_02290 [Magnetococcales bacterium]|nr:hypothetical protein [Magnetococcales bacterium]
MIVDTEFLLAQTQVLEGSGDYLPAFLYQQNVKTGITSGTNTLSLKALGTGGTTRLLGIPHDGLVGWAATGGTKPTVELVNGENKFLWIKFNAAAADTPSYYSIQGDTMTLFPTPNANCDIYINGMFADVDWDSMANTDTNLWLRYAGDWLMAESSRRVAQHIGDKEAEGRFAAESELAKKRVMSSDQTRAMQQRVGH